MLLHSTTTAGAGALAQPQRLVGVPQHAERVRNVRTFPSTAFERATPSVEPPVLTRSTAAEYRPPPVEGAVPSVLLL